MGEEIHQDVDQDEDPPFDMSQIKRIFRRNFRYNLGGAFLIIFDCVFFHGALIARRPSGRL